MGFMVLDHVAEILEFSFEETRKPQRYARAELQIGEARAIFLKPLEFMNRSGGPVSAVKSFYKIRPKDVMVVHDDLDIKLGRMKFVRSGGAGGHNGIRSIIDALGTRDFPRLKIGINRPPPEIPADRYVLSRFTKEELPLLEKVTETASRALIVFVEKGLDQAMNEFNGISIT